MNRSHAVIAATSVALVAGCSTGNAQTPEATTTRVVTVTPAATSTTTAPDTKSVIGNVALYSDSYGVKYRTDGTCTGIGGFDDITEGAQVVIADGSDNTLAIGSLLKGITFPATGTTKKSCAFAFNVPNVPMDQPFYKVSVTHRGAVTFTQDQMRDGGVDLSLGDSD